MVMNKNSSTRPLCRSLLLLLYLSFLSLMVLSSQSTMTMALKLNLSPNVPNLAQQKSDLENELKASGIALANLLAKIDKEEIPYTASSISTKASNDVMGHPDVVTAIAVVKRWNYLQEKWQHLASSSNQMNLFEVILYNIASIEVLLGYLLYRINDYTAALMKLEKSCPVLWKQKQKWKESPYDGWINCFSITGEIYSSQRKNDSLKRLEIFLVDTISGIESIFPPTTEHSTLYQFLQLSNDELRYLSGELKSAWIIADDIRSISKSLIKDTLQSKSVKLRRAIVVKSRKVVIERLKSYSMDDQDFSLPKTSVSTFLEPKRLHQVFKQLMIEEYEIFHHELQQLVESLDKKSSSSSSTTAAAGKEQSSKLHVQIVDKESSLKTASSPTVSPSPNVDTSSRSPAPFVSSSPASVPEDATRDQQLMPSMEYHLEEEEYQEMLALQEQLLSASASESVSLSDSEKQDSISKSPIIVSPPRDKPPKVMSDSLRKQQSSFFTQQSLELAVGFRTEQEVLQIVKMIVANEKKVSDYVDQFNERAKERQYGQGRISNSGTRLPTGIPTVSSIKKDSTIPENSESLEHHLQLQPWQNVLLGLITFLLCYFGSRHLLARHVKRNKGSPTSPNTEGQAVVRPAGGTTSLKSSYFSSQHQASRPRQRLQQVSSKNSTTTQSMTGSTGSAGSSLADWMIPANKSRKQALEELLQQEDLEKKEREKEEKAKQQQTTNKKNNKKPIEKDKNKNKEKEKEKEKAIEKSNKGVVHENVSVSSQQSIVVSAGSITSSIPAQTFISKKQRTSTPSLSTKTNAVTTTTAAAVTIKDNTSVSQQADEKKNEDSSANLIATSMTSTTTKEVAEVSRESMLQHSHDEPMTATIVNIPAPLVMEEARDDAEDSEMSSLTTSCTEDFIESHHRLLTSKSIIKHSDSLEASLKEISNKMPLSPPIVTKEVTLPIEASVTMKTVKDVDSQVHPIDTSLGPTSMQSPRTVGQSTAKYQRNTVESKVAMVPNATAANSNRTAQPTNRSKGKDQSPAAPVATALSASGSYSGVTSMTSREDATNHNTPNMSPSPSPINTTSAFETLQQLHPYASQQRQSLKGQFRQQRMRAPVATNYGQFQYSSNPGASGNVLVAQIPPPPPMTVPMSMSIPIPNIPESRAIPPHLNMIPAYPTQTPLVSIPPPPPHMPSSSMIYPNAPYHSHMIVPMGQPMVPYPPQSGMTYENTPVPVMMPVLLYPVNSSFASPSQSVPHQYIMPEVQRDDIPQPISFGTFDVDDQVVKDCAIMNQIEYYFSAENLSKDGYMRTLMDHDGFVFVDEILKFRRIVNMHASVDEVVAALQQSKCLEVMWHHQSNCWKVRSMVS